MNQTSVRPGTPGAFTLIELLVVIDTVTVLAALLLPGLMARPAQASVSISRVTGAAPMMCDVLR